MKLNVKAMGLTVGLLWGACMLLVGLANLIWPGYGVAVLQMSASMYPGYEVGGFGSVIVGTLYGVVDGVICGVVLAWLYNRLAGSGA